MMTRLACSKGGEGEAHELLPCTSTMRDWHKPQGSGTFPLLVPPEQGGDLGAGSAPFGCRARCLPVRAVLGVGTSCPPLDAKGRFPAL